MADNTNTTNITVNMENLNDTERKQLLALIEKANEPQSNIWKPKCRDDYYRITGYSNIQLSTWRNDNEDNNCYNMGNCFRTKADAEFELERRKVVHELRVLANGYKPKKGKGWFYISYNLDADKPVVEGKYSYTILPMVCFETFVQAQNVIDIIGADRLKKYYFMVE